MDEKKTDNLRAERMFRSVGGQKGYTLIEIVMVIVILGIVGGITFQFVAHGVEAFKKSRDRKDLYDQGRLALERMVRELRDTKEVTGSASSSITFKKAHPAQAADNTEEIKFELNGTNLERVGDPSGTPVTAILASNVSSFAVTYAAGGGGGGGSCSASPTVYANAISTTYTVPADCDTLTVKTWGAGGGGGNSQGQSGGAGGGGGYASSVISVTPLETLDIVVGGGGSGSGGGGDGGGGAVVAGGGAAGAAGSTPGGGGGGGGYAAVKRGATFLVQAGGGGGGGGGEDNAGGAGGAGGGGSGIAGGAGADGAGGGGGGTQLAGGTGGGCSGGCSGGAGASGTANQGGAGGSNSGAGGGGGQYGGGGGGGDDDGAAGGGGGSGLGDTLTAGSGTSAGNTGDTDYAGNAGQGGAGGTGGAGGDGNPGRVVIIPGGSGGGGTNLVMVTTDGTTTTDANDTLKRTLFESWGWTVTAIDDGAAQAIFDNAAANNDVMYISESSGSSSVDTAATVLDIGIVVEEDYLWDEMEFGNPGDGGVSHDTINITDNSHYITSPFAIGDLLIYSNGYDGVGSLGSPSPTLASGGKPLANENAGSSPTLFVFDTGATLDSGTAVNRRVGVPSRVSDATYWTDDLKTLLQRSLDWAAGNDVTSNVVTLELTLSSPTGGDVTIRTKVFMRNMP